MKMISRYLRNWLLFGYDLVTLAGFLIREFLLAVINVLQKPWLASRWLNLLLMPLRLVLVAFIVLGDLVLVLTGLPPFIVLALLMNGQIRLAFACRNPPKVE